MWRIFDFLKESVIVDDNGVDHIPRDNTPGLYSLHRTRYRRIDRG